MVSALQLRLEYDGRKVRVVGTPENPEWVAADVCEVLGIATPERAYSRIPDSRKGMRIVHTLGGPQKMVTVTKAGLYNLIFFSRKPEAERFKTWMFEQVIPSIERYGCYPPPEAMTVHERHSERSLARAEMQAALEPIVSRIERVENKVDDLTSMVSTVSERIRLLPTYRKEIPQVICDRQDRCVHDHYHDKCPCCRTVRILDSNGKPLPNLRRDHWHSRGRVGLRDTWPVCEECNGSEVLGDPGSIQRGKYEYLFKSFLDWLELTPGHGADPNVGQKSLFEIGGSDA